MNQCSFCGNSITQGTGLIYVKRTGKRFDFCSRKCENNLMQMDRNPRNYKWTKEYWKEKGIQEKKTSGASAGKEEKAGAHDKAAGKTHEVIKKKKKKK